MRRLDGCDDDDGVSLMLRARRSCKLIAWNESVCSSSSSSSGGVAGILKLSAAAAASLPRRPLVCGAVCVR